MIFNTVIQTILTLLGITYMSSPSFIRLDFQMGYPFAMGAPLSPFFLLPRSFLVQSGTDSLGVDLSGPRFD